MPAQWKVMVALLVYILYGSVRDTRLRWSIVSRFEEIALVAAQVLIYI